MPIIHTSYCKRKFLSDLSEVRLRLDEAALEKVGLKSKYAYVALQLSIG